LDEVENSDEFSASASYEAFAEIYDEIMTSVPYSCWCDYLLFLCRYLGAGSPKRLLELACGTGSMMEQFLRKADIFMIDGLDRSGAMLEKARQKLSDHRQMVELSEQDMRSFALARNYDLIYSVFDSMNYILDLDDLKEVFAAAAGHLSEDGLFIFDYNTRSRLKSIESGYSHFEGEEFTCQWQDIVREEENIWEVKLTISLTGRSGFYRERHLETAFPLSSLEELLRSQGFKFVRCYDNISLNRGTETSSRVYFVAGLSPPADTSLVRKAGLRARWALKKIKYFVGLS